jgi:hypothetical protein
MSRSVWGSPALPIAMKKVDNPNAAKMPPRISRSDIAVLGVKRAIICGLPRVFSVRRVTLSIVVQGPSPARFGTNHSSSSFLIRIEPNAQRDLTV